MIISRLFRVKNFILFLFVLFAFKNCIDFFFFKLLCWILESMVFELTSLTLCAGVEFQHIRTHATQVSGKGYTAQHYDNTIVICYLHRSNKIIKWLTGDELNKAIVADYVHALSTVQCLLKIPCLNILFSVVVVSILNWWAIGITFNGLAAARVWTSSSAGFRC